MRSLLLGLCLLASAAQAGDTLRIVSPDYWCPFSCKEGAAQEGFTIDILRAIFEPLGYRVDFSNANYSRALQQVRAGHSDAIPSALKAEAPDFVFPRQPISRNRFCVYASPDSQWNYQTPADLQDHQVGLIQGYDYGSDLSAWFADHPQQLSILTGDDLVQRMTGMLGLQRLDSFIEEENLVAFVQRQQPQLKLRKAGCAPPIYGFLGLSAANPRARQISREFDAGLRRLRRSGELANILGRYGLSDWQS